MGNQIQKRTQLQKHIDTGRSYIERNELTVATEHFLQALKLAEEIKDQTKATEAILGLGDAYILNDMFQKALEHYEKAVQITKEREDKKNETNAYIRLRRLHIEKIITFKRQLNTMKKPCKLQKNDKINKLKQLHTLG